MTYIQHYQSPLGGILLAADEEGLTGLWFDGQKYFGDTLPKECDEKSSPVLEQSARWLDIYFGGKAPDFTPPLCLRTTPFRRAVWEILLTIPFGQTMTYGEIAEKVAKQKGLPKMSAQAVGGANGSLTGYAGGIGKKVQLLKLEKADMSGLFVPKKGTAL